MEKGHCQKYAEQSVSYKKGGAGLIILCACAMKNRGLREQTRDYTHVLPSRAQFPQQVDNHRRKYAGVWVGTGGYTCM